MIHEGIERRLKKDMKRRFNFKKKSKILMFGLIGLLCISSVFAVWFYLGYEANIHANIIGKTHDPMIITVPLTDFGVIDYNNGASLVNIKNFTLESPLSNGATRVEYKVLYNVTRTELDPENCIYTDDEIVFNLYKNSGYGTIGEIFSGDVIATANNDVAGSSDYALVMTSVSASVCPADYEFALTFLPQ